MREQQAAKEEIHELYNAYSNDIYRYALMMMGNSSDAYDIVQEVFVRAFRNWSNFRRDANAKTWLMSIARNYIFDLFRKKRTENKFVTSYNPPVETDESANVATMLDVEVALSKLKGSYRQVIILRYVENLSIREVAEVLGWGEDKVRNTTHLAMTELRKLLKNDPEEEDKNEIRTSSFRTT